MQCPNCAAGVGTTQKFCGECGTRLAPTGGALRLADDNDLPVRPEPATLAAADDDAGADILDAEVVDDRAADDDLVDGGLIDDALVDERVIGHAEPFVGNDDDDPDAADLDAADLDAADPDVADPDVVDPDAADPDAADADSGDDQDSVDGAGDAFGDPDTLDSADDTFGDPDSADDQDPAGDSEFGDGEFGADDQGPAGDDGRDAGDHLDPHDGVDDLGHIDSLGDLGAGAADADARDDTETADAPVTVTENDAWPTTVMPAVGSDAAKSAPPPPPPPPMAPPVVAPPPPPAPAPPAPAPPAPPAPAPHASPVEPTPAAGVPQPASAAPPPSPAGGHPLFDPITGQQAQIPTAVNPAVPGTPTWTGGQQPSGSQPQQPQQQQPYQQPLPYQPGQGYQQPSPYQPGHAGQPSQPYGQHYGGYVQPEPTAVHGYNPYALEPQPVPYGYGGDEDDWDDEREPRGFKLRLMLIPALLTAVAAVIAITQTLIDIASGASAVAGTWKINDFGTNLTIGLLICAGMAVLGALLACFGHRWAAGLAGGAGLSLAGIVVIPLALIDILSDAVVGAGTLERTLGYWALVATGGLGVLTFLLSLTRSGDDGRAGLDPWVAALGALATVAAVAGPFIPVNGARLDENWSQLPTWFLVARFVHLGLLLLAGVIGFLLVRRYGLGLAIGGALGVGWLLVSSQFDLTDRPLAGASGITQASPAPLPPGIFNPGDIEGKPHIVTIAGVALIGFFALVATVMALIDRD